VGRSGPRHTDSTFTLARRSLSLVLITEPTKTTAAFSKEPGATPGSDAQDAEAVRGCPPSAKPTAQLTMTTNHLRVTGDQTPMLAVGERVVASVGTPRVV